MATTLGAGEMLPGRESAWRPWLGRVLVILVHWLGLESARPSPEEFNNWISSEFGNPLPSDLQGVVDSAHTLDDAVASSREASTIGFVAGPVAAPRTLSRDVSTILDRLKFEFRQLTERFIAPGRADLHAWLFWALTILTMIGALWGLGYALGWLAGILRSMGVMRAWAAPMLLALVIAGVITGMALTLLVRTRARITLEEIASSSELERSRALITAQLTIEIPRPHLRPTAPTVISGTCTAGGARRYNQNSLSADLQTAMKSLSSSAEVKLEIPNGLPAPCWEGSLTHSLEGPGADVRRTSGAFVQRPPVAGPFELRIAACGADGIVASMIRDGWAVLSTTDTTLVIIPGAPPRASDATVVHLVGHVEETGSGTVLELAGSREPLRAADVAERFPRAQLCIVQGPPLKRFETRRDGTRRDANVARWFAHEIHARGLPVVVVIPPLEAKPGAAAVSHIANRLKSPESLGVRQLMRAARRIRTTIQILGEVTSADRSELASDVCVYCPDHWKLVHDGVSVHVS